YPAVAYAHLRGSRGELVREVVDLRHGDIEPERLDMPSNGVERLVGSPPQLYSFRGQSIRPRRSGRSHLLGQVVDQPPDALDEPPGARNTRFRPNDIALRRAVRQHEPARAIGAVVGDDVIRIH